MIIYTHTNIKENFTKNTGVKRKTNWVLEATGTEFVGQLQATDRKRW